MIQKLSALTIFTATALTLTAQSLIAQTPFVISVVATDDSANTRTLAFGILPTANSCIDTADHFGGYQEFREPPVPPTGILDTRFDDPSGSFATPCFDQGSLVDFRPLAGTGQVDTFLVRVQDGTGGRPIHFAWPSGLNTYAVQLTMIDQFGGLAGINVDMLTATSFELNPSMPSSFYIIMAPIIVQNVGLTFTTLDPDSIFNADPLRPGKSMKPVKRFKGFGPNWSNLLSEIVVQGGFANGTTESDSAGGMLIGSSFMFLKSAASKKWAPIKDSASHYCWIRLSAYNQIKNVGKNFADIQKSLADKTGGHFGIARGLDSTGNPWDISRKQLRKELKKFPPKIQGNRLFAELLALKVNIAASAMGKTPAGFGDLLYARTGHPYDGKSIIAISAHLDSAMTFWQTIGPNGGGEWDSAYNALYEINRAFRGPLDTLSWEAGGDSAKLVLNGNADVNTVSFIALPPGGLVPTRTTAANNLWEAPDEFEDDEFDEPSGVPLAMKLYRNYPNPFNPSTKIAFRLREASIVTLRVYNILGQEVTTLLENEDLEEGLQTVDFTAAGLASGVYFYRLEAQNPETGDFMLPTVGKMILCR